MKNTRRRLRPTSSLVRNAIFNILGNILGEISGKTFIDLFAGTGGVGLEAERRGAKVIFVERDPYLVRELAGKTRGKVVRADTLKYLKTLKDKADIIFADPPYSFRDYRKLITLCLERLSPEGIFILEHERKKDFPCDQRKEYGDTALSIWRVKK